MIGPGAIVAQRLGGVAAEENRTGVADLLGERERLLDGEFEMFGAISFTSAAASSRSRTAISARVLRARHG